MRVSLGKSTQDEVTPSEGASPLTANRRLTRGLTRGKLVVLLQGQGLLIMLALIILFFAMESDSFFTWSNVVVIGASSTALGIMSVAQTYVIISGGIDVSVGSMVAVSTVVTGILFSYGWSFWPVVAVAVLAGAVVGAVNALIIIAMGVNPFIATLGTMSLFAGLAFAIASGKTRVVNDKSLQYLGIGKIGTLPVAFVVFLKIGRASCRERV